RATPRIEPPRPPWARPLLAGVANAAPARDFLHARADELDVLADLVVAAESHGAVVVSLPSLGNLDRDELPALPTNAEHDHEGPARRRAIVVIDYPRDRRDGIPLQILDADRGAANGRLLRLSLLREGRRLEHGGSD